MQLQYRSYRTCILITFIAGRNTKQISYHGGLKQIISNNSQRKLILFWCNIEGVFWGPEHFIRAQSYLCPQSRWQDGLPKICQSVTDRRDQTRP